MMRNLFVLIMFCFTISSASFAEAANYGETKLAADITVTKNHKSAIQDPTYPKYHLRAPSGWINDPCGLFYFNSSFHVFCQSNPWGSQWGNMTWSHMVSQPDKKFNYKWFYPEYKNGTYKTSALMQSLNIKGPDKNGIFTGCAEILPYYEKNEKGVEEATYYPTVFYSGVWGIGEDKQEVICMARALSANKTNEKGELVDPFLTDWTKYSTVSKDDPNSMPSIIINQPKELNLISFRDPYHVAIADDKNYYISVSGGIIDKNGKPKGVLLLYKNNGNDLTKGWERVNKGNDFFFEVDTAVKDEVTGGGDIECGVVYKLTDHIGTTNNTPYIAIFGQDGSPAEPYGKSIYYVLGQIEKKESGIKFSPLKDFIDKSGNVIKKHLDLNPNFIFYSSTTILIDNEQRNYFFGWLNIESQANDGNEYPWAGALSSPRFLFVYKDNNKWKLAQEPVLINALRGKELYNKKIELDKNGIELDNIEGRCLNVSTVFQGDDLRYEDFGLKVACSGDKNTEIKISKGNLIIDREKPIDLGLPENTKKYGVNVYLDGSTLEIFFSLYKGDVLIGHQVYSSGLNNNGSLENNKIIVFGDSSTTAEISVYEMNSCWTEMPR